MPDGQPQLEGAVRAATQDATGPRLLVVVPALNEAGGIEACLRTILDGLPPAALIVVADGGSEDGTRAIVRRLAEAEPRLSLTRNEGRRQAAGVNAVVAAAPPGRDLIVRCDAHAAYPPGFVRGVADAMLRTGAGTLAVAMDAAPAPDTGPTEKANAAIFGTLLGAGGSAHRGGTRSGWVDHGHHAGLSRGWFERLGGYDEGLIANEDAEYDTRLRRAGSRVWLEASLRMTYRPRGTLGAIWRQQHAYGQGRAAHLMRHRLRPRLRQLAPAIHVALVAACVLGACVSGAPALLAYPAFYLAVLVGLSGVMTLRRRALWALLCGPCVLVTHTAWGLGFWRGVWDHLTRRGAA